MIINEEIIKSLTKDTWSISHDKLKNRIKEIMGGNIKDNELQILWERIVTKRFIGDDNFPRKTLKITLTDGVDVIGNRSGSPDASKD